MTRNRIYFCFLFSMALLVLLLGPLAAQAGAETKAKKVDLNTASLAKIEALKGVGPSLAGKIIAARPFKSVADLKNVSGIGQAKFDDLKDLVTVEPPKPAKTETVAKRSEKAAAEELVNLNTAGKAAIENLPGVGSALAEKIIAARPFKSVADLKKVKGIGQEKFDKLKKLVTIKSAKAAKAVETKAKSTTRSTEQPSSLGLVDLNSADKAALEALPGIGSVLAEKIIGARPFKSIDDLKMVSGIGQEIFAGVRDLVTVEEEETAVFPKLKPGETININTASAERLDSLLGIGPVKAAAIIAGRPYAKIADIMKVKGIKEKTFAKIKEFIVVR